MHEDLFYKYVTCYCEYIYSAVLVLHEFLYAWSGCWPELIINSAAILSTTYRPPLSDSIYKTVGAPLGGYAAHCQIQGCGVMRNGQISVFLASGEEKC